MNEKTARLINRYASSQGLVPRDVKRTWKDATRKQQTAWRQVMKRAT